MEHLKMTFAARAELQAWEPGACICTHRGVLVKNALDVGDQASKPIRPFGLGTDSKCEVVAEEALLERSQPGWCAA
jgi:hypothetical protein